MKTLNVVPAWWLWWHENHLMPAKVFCWHAQCHGQTASKSPSLSHHAGHASHASTFLKPFGKMGGGIQLCTC